METFVIGTSKKALDEKLLRFLRRLGTIHERWMVCGDIWVPAERAPKTRPGMHFARNPFIELNHECANYVYTTEPIGDIMDEVDKLEGKVRNVELVQDPEMITLEVQVRGDGTRFIIVIARRLITKDNLYPAMLQNTTFHQFMESQGYWTEIKQDTLMNIKKGNVFQIEDNGFVMARLVRNMFKLRGRSERINAEITYTAKYCIILKAGKTTAGIPGAIGFLLYVDYGFIETISNYINVPYPLDVNLVAASVDLGLFDEDDADDGLEVVD